MFESSRQRPISTDHYSAIISPQRNIRCFNRISHFLQWNPYAMQASLQHWSAASLLLERRNCNHLRKHSPSIPPRQLTEYLLYAADSSDSTSRASPGSTFTTELTVSQGVISAHERNHPEIWACIWSSLSCMTVIWCSFKLAPANQLHDSDDWPRGTNLQAAIISSLFESASIFALSVTNGMPGTSSDILRL